MAQTLTDAILNSIQAGLTREAIITAWVMKEASFGHWGYQGRNFRTTVGSADEHGSFGFNQILNRYRYGGPSRSADLLTLNFYDPADAIRALAVFSNSLTAGQGTGGGFAKAFTGNPPVYRVTQTFPAGSYPHLGASYVDDFKDLLSKGIMAYNRGSLLGDFTSRSWPDFLREYPPPEASTPFGTRTAIMYSLGIQHNAAVTPRTWTWTDIENGQVFTFTYSESEWRSGVSWQTKRDQSVPT